MTTLFGNRAVEETRTAGTGTYDLDGAVSGFQTLVESIFDLYGVTGPWEVNYFVTDGTDWEVGIGTLTDGTPDTVTRDDIEQSSNNNLPIDWVNTAAPKHLFLAPSAFLMSSLLDEDRGLGFLAQTGVSTYEGVPHPLPITEGGTGGKSTVEARKNLFMLENKFTEPGQLLIGDGPQEYSLLSSIGEDVHAVLQMQDSGRPGWSTGGWQAGQATAPPRYFHGWSLNSMDGQQFGIVGGVARTRFNDGFISIFGPRTMVIDAAWSWDSLPGVGNEWGAVPRAIGNIRPNRLYYIFAIKDNNTEQTSIGVDLDPNCSNLLYESQADVYICLGWFRTKQDDNYLTVIDETSWAIRFKDRFIQDAVFTLETDQPETIVIPHALAPAETPILSSEVSLYFYGAPHHGYPDETYIPMSGISSGGGNSTDVGWTDGTDGVNWYISRARIGAGSPMPYAVVMDEFTTANMTFSQVSYSETTVKYRLQAEASVKISKFG